MRQVTTEELSSPAARLDPEVLGISVGGQPSSIAASIELPGEPGGALVV